MHDPVKSALLQVADPLSPATLTTRASQRLNTNGLAWFSANTDKLLSKENIFFIQQSKEVLYKRRHTGK
jgi:hypothetical protein